ncbi:hypothetical protein BGW36DRAFT_288548 [Talaromyces proteolyticus]|uniref:Uncharacterized protein n=1 Tax=Talaromyces proteolyticus TaxID=1131652 RepID=A0AAD4Q0H0_9EURO|nr:uncharacterized protein BGW36DRAFT_288548 [Talaromyces proteolyticus]KAH8704088.1 hypothetical protein BGW36DRAFT_288548 [Talaromyces proteolyticus]
MLSLDLRALKALYIITTSAFLSFLIVFYSHHMVASDVIHSLVSAFPFTNDKPVPAESTFDTNTIELILGNHNEEPILGDHDIELVVASLKEQNTSWYSVYFPDWKHNIYIVNDLTASLTVPRNKGHEAMVYLTYIIDRYDNLPNNTVFLHADRFQWHNDNPDYDGVPLLRDLQFAYLQEEGYVNLRCVWVLGCPAAIHPFNDEAISDEHNEQATGEIFRQVFEELLPGHPVPTEVGVSCCSQFAATREAIQQRPKDDYIRFREWLLNTPFQDGLSGRFFEYSWHIIFGKDPVYCPSAADCYCKVYGMCDLPNCTTGECKGRYNLPPYATLPDGWPRVGWNGEERPFSGP